MVLLLDLGGGGEGVVSSVDAFEAVAESSGIRGETGAPDEACEGDDGGREPAAAAAEGETGGRLPPPLADETESRFGSGSAVPGPP